ncbi:hypothetical protein C8N24_0704 [Solirubrobacter pauli]|uniref:Uncharacterized protein n=1 Tax=Solirubrobacter pauli TaxID=166793 RepID=A0A660L8P4_9ACTN|nr:hypothetical protein [Solirubrobacter pauli]RKQ90889.1 hypothetical protein C8N24_0704 [Solirubrobacter pauli]
MLTELRGQRATISIHYDADVAPADAPMIAAAKVSFSPLGTALGRGQGDELVRRLSRRMSSRADGLWLALCDVPDASRRFALVQSDRSSVSVPNFYERHHTRRDEIWRDYYYAAAYVLVREIDRRWPETTDVVLSHPTGHGWPQGLIESVFDGLWHLADNEELTLRHLHVDACCLESPAELERGLDVVDRAQRGGRRRTAHRSLKVDEARVESLGLDGIDGVRLFRVALASGRGPSGQDAAPRQRLVGGRRGQARDG